MWSDGEFPNVSIFPLNCIQMNPFHADSRKTAYICVYHGPIVISGEAPTLNHHGGTTWHREINFASKTSMDFKNWIYHHKQKTAEKYLKQLLETWHLLKNSVFLEYNPFFGGLENQLSTKIMCRWCANTRDIFSAQQQHYEDQRCARQNSQQQQKTTTSCKLFTNLPVKANLTFFPQLLVLGILPQGPMKDQQQKRPSPGP